MVKKDKNINQSIILNSKKIFYKFKIHTVCTIYDKFCYLFSIDLVCEAGKIDSA